MKKLVFALAIVATLVVALLSTGNVFAQGTTPPTPQTPGSGAGYGRGGAMGNGGMRGGAGMGVAGTGQGVLHNGIITAFAQKLGISVDDLNARLTKGETMAQIAASKGLTAEQFTTLMTDARTQAMDQAVKAGTLTQAQADWMNQRQGGMMGGNAERGAGRGMRGNAADCPYFPQTNP